MNINEVKKRIPSFYKNIEYYDNLDSTNTLIKNGNYHHGDIIIADSQNRGRGRNGKTFHSPAGKGIYFSFLINPQLNINEALKITALVSVSLVKAIQKNYHISPQIKWVNDLIINDKKIAGILCESTLKSNYKDIDKMIIGIGINVHSYNMPDDLKDSAGCIEDFTNIKISRQKIIIDFLNIFYDDYLNLSSSNFMHDYRQYSYILDQHINVYENNHCYEAYVQSINDDGTLTIITNNQTQILQSGEISIRKIKENT